MLAEEQRATVAVDRFRWVFPLAVLLGLAVVVGLEIAAHHYGLRGPTFNLARELVAAPKRGPVLWAGLALAMVGLTPRERLTAGAIAAAIDLAFFLGRLPGGGRATFGNGALIVLVGLAVWAAAGWREQPRPEALKGVGLGLILILATKISDTWLHITALARPEVLDEYVQTADHSLGNPSWWMGRLVETSGLMGHRILETVYIQLPLGAIIVALYQLRKGWPSHHLVRTFLVIGMIGPAFYLLFPVVGPVYAFGASGHGFAVSHVWPTFGNMDLSPAALAFDDFTPRNCMPSLHTAWAVAIFVHSRQGPFWLRAFGTFWLVCTLVATLGFGYHYGVDLLAGVVFALTIESALRDPERGWGWFRWRLVLGGSFVLAALLVSYRYLAVPLAEVPEVSGPLLLATTGGVIAAFYATFFARPGSAVAAWGRSTTVTLWDRRLAPSEQAWPGRGTAR